MTDPKPNQPIPPDPNNPNPNPQQPQRPAKKKISLDDVLEYQKNRGVPQ